MTEVLNRQEDSPIGGEFFTFNVSHFITNNFNHNDVVIPVKSNLKFYHEIIIASPWSAAIM